MTQSTTIHERWIRLRHGLAVEPFRQCGGCLHWIALGGELGRDWGACSNAASAFDAQLMFEHHGCDEFVEDPHGFGVQRG